MRKNAGGEVLELYLCPDISRRAQVYALLARAAARSWGWAELPSLARTPKGKPFFPDAPERCFSLSHSGSLALCVLDNRPVGADIERLRPHHPQLPQRICSPEQLEWFQQQDDPQRALCRLWTLKECRVKYEGTGLTVPIRTISIPLPSPGTAVVHDALTFLTLDGPDWSAAVCGHSAPSPVHCIQADQLSL
jgi:4'-phosphopantetheinyl transferase